MSLGAQILWSVSMRQYILQPHIDSIISLLVVLETSSPSIYLDKMKHTIHIINHEISSCFFITFLSGMKLDEVVVLLLLFSSEVMGQDKN